MNGSRASLSKLDGHHLGRGRDPVEPEGHGGGHCGDRAGDAPDHAEAGLPQVRGDARGLLREPRPGRRGAAQRQDGRAAGEGRQADVPHLDWDITRSIQGSNKKYTSAYAAAWESMRSQTGCFDVFHMANNIAYYAEGSDVYRLHLEAGLRRRVQGGESDDLEDIKRLASSSAVPALIQAMLDKVKEMSAQRAKEKDDVEDQRPYLGSCAGPACADRSCDWNTYNLLYSNRIALHVDSAASSPSSSTCSAHNKAQTQLQCGPASPPACASELYCP
ncbi:hypothetical protein THAOC_33580 [Thalassiosira oceanica]|uniref:Uncharacterized protein n=1 Tax=Thalassiosira oceanica TaxID=159749 RepID=K0R6W9_THAOC|nr:hypothetical protein THAOC_33580 [Thalassiosira oceanica]|eukprot:EJK47684.1 hypothetical protein THAOC_33580 [Thalassiosira oceanica]